MRIGYCRGVLICYANSVGQAQLASQLTSRIDGCIRRRSWLLIFLNDS